MLEHPLILPLVDTVVRLSLSLSLCSPNVRTMLKYICCYNKFIHHIVQLNEFLQVGTADCVMGLSKTLTEKLMQEALVETMV